MAPSKFYIPSLDGIRTIAFVIVFLSHAGATHIAGGTHLNFMLTEYGMLEGNS